MSVNRDPKVGDRFTWVDGWPAVKVVTSVDDYRVYYRFEYFDDSIQYPTKIKDWRADAFLVDPDLDVPAVGTEFKWNSTGQDDPSRKVRTVRYVDAEHDVVLWADTDGKVGTVPLSQWGQKAQSPDSETPPEWPGGAFLAWGLIGVWYVPTSPVRAAENGSTVYHVEPLPTGKVLLHPLRKDGSRW